MPSRSRRAGSPKSETPTAADRSPLVLGIDLGATKVVSGLVAPDGAIVRHSGRHLHANDGPDGVLRTLVASARACLTGPEAPPGAIGISVAAQIDPASGSVVHAPNLGWRDFPLGRRLEEEFGAPVVVINDAHAAGLAEGRFGAGSGIRNLFCLVLGTGVGGAAILDGRLRTGGHHALGEVGHLTIVAGGRKCHCPNRGCFEAYVGGWGIAERAREAIAGDPEGGDRLLATSGGLDDLSAQAVFRAHRAGDPLANRLVRETEQYLADGVVSVTNAFNPSVLVLGGGLVAGMPEFIGVAAEAVRSRCQPSAATAEVRAARLGENAAIVGAAERARSAAAQDEA